MAALLSLLVVGDFELRCSASTPFLVLTGVCVRGVVCCPGDVSGVVGGVLPARGYGLPERAWHKVSVCPALLKCRHRRLLIPDRECFFRGCRTASIFLSLLARRNWTEYIHQFTPLCLALLHLGVKWVGTHAYHLFCRMQNLFQPALVLQAFPADNASTMLRRCFDDACAGPHVNTRVPTGLVLCVGILYSFLSFLVILGLVCSCASSLCGVYAEFQQPMQPSQGYMYTC